MARRIPIRNLYYLLCYAWNVLDERDDTLVSELAGLSAVELLAKVLRPQGLRDSSLARGRANPRPADLGGPEDPPYGSSGRSALLGGPKGPPYG